MIETQNVESQEAERQEIELKDIETSEGEDAQNPWPHIDEYFSFVTKEGDNIIFSCQLCRPKRVLAKAHKTTLSNLKQHIRRSHNAELCNFQESLKQRSSKSRRRLSSDCTNSSYVSSNALSPVKVETQQDQSPWPHLDDYFLFISREGDRFVFNCKMCLPKNVLINGHRTSLNNLKQHINRAHATYSIPFLETVREGSCRGKCKKRLSVASNNNNKLKKNVLCSNSSNQVGKNDSLDSVNSTSFEKDEISMVSSSNSITALISTPVEAETLNNNIPQQDQTENPWPRLSEFFWLESRQDDKYVFVCRICMPKNVLIKAHRSTLSNLKQHIRRTHPANFKEFLSKIKKGRKNKPRKMLYSDMSSEDSILESIPAIKKPRQHTKPYGSEVSQSLVEQRIVDFFVSNLLPHSAVESETFEKLIRTLNPTKHSISRRTLGRRISNRQHDGLKQHLIRVLSEVKWVSVSVDCCFAHKKGYLGMTVHWIDPSSRKMHSAVLSCMHFTSQQNQLELQQSMLNVQREFWIEHKITRTTIGENFVKSNFSLEGHANIHMDTQTNTQTRVDSTVTALLTGCVDEQQLQYITLSNPLVDNNHINHLNLPPPHITNHNHLTYSNHNQLTYANTDTNHHPITYSNPHSNQTQLICVNPTRIQASNHINHTITNHNNHTTPQNNHHHHSNNTTTITKHLTCAAHILNLVASEDAETALQFNGAYISALSKARSLWNLHDSSLVAADNVLAEVGVRLLVPDASRWCSSYEAVVVLNGVLEGKRNGLHRVMLHLKLSPFDDQDVYFLKEYTMTMSPVAKALEKLQREDQAYLGTLLPTIAATIFRLNDLKSQGLVYCSSLVDSLLISIYKRFEVLLEDQECQLAAAFHPRFRLIWLEKFNSTKISCVRKMMEDQVEECIRNYSSTPQTTTTTNSLSHDEDDFFSVVTNSQDNNSNNNISSNNSISNNNRAQHLVSTWLEAGSNDLLSDAAFLGEDVLVQLFLRFNTATPSCASVDRLFSKGTDLLHKKSSLSDDKFDMLIFMKGNMHLMDKIENGRMVKKNMNL